MKLNLTIRTITSDQYPNFYCKELTKNVKPSRNYYQLYESKTNAKDQPVKYFYPDHDKDAFYFLAYSDDLIVGQLSLKQSPFTDDILWFTGISVDPKYQNRGIAKALIDEAFRLVNHKNRNILMSYYEDDVKDFLPALIKNKAIQHKVVIYERDDDYVYHTYGIDKKGKVYDGQIFQGEKK